MSAKYPRSARLSRSSFTRSAAVSFTLAALSWFSPAHAAPGDLATKFRVDDDNPSARIPSLEERNGNPMEFSYFLQDLFTKGELAREKQDWKTAVKYFEALTKAVPERALSYARACQGYEALGQVELGIDRCVKAVQLGGATLYDHLRLLRLVLSKSTLTPGDIAGMDASIAHVRKHLETAPADPPVPPLATATQWPAGHSPTGAEIAADFARIKETNRLHREAESVGKDHAQLVRDFELLVCRQALRLRDDKRLSACVDALQRQKAEERTILPFAWTRALVQHDRARATTFLDRAKALGIPAPTLQAMAAEQEKALAPKGLAGFFKRFGLLTALAALGLGGVGLLWLRGRGRKLEPANQRA